MEVSLFGWGIVENLGGIALRGGLGQKYLVKEFRLEFIVLIYLFYVYLKYYWEFDFCLGQIYKYILFSVYIKDKNLFFESIYFI